MSNGQASYQSSNGSLLQLFIDVDLKTERIQDFFCKGNLLEIYRAEMDELKSLVLNQTIGNALGLTRLSLKHAGQAIAPLGLWLLHQAIEDYLGTASSLEEDRDLLCLCYGIGIKDLKKQITTRSDYDLPQLVAETMATSACASCKTPIVLAMNKIREEHGLILGLEHSQSRTGKDGHWIKIKGLYPADLLIKLDELKNVWMKRENIEEQFSIEITKIEGYHIWLKVSAEEDRATKVLAALSDYWRSVLGALFFLHLAS